MKISIFIDSYSKFIYSLTYTSSNVIFNVINSKKHLSNAILETIYIKSNLSLSEFIDIFLLKTKNNSNGIMLIPIISMFEAMYDKLIFNVKKP